MNFDDFEKKLQRQPLRRVPDDWRRSILRTARNHASVTDQPAQPMLIRAVMLVWRELIQPCRYTWSAMAALWVMFWLINGGMQTVDRSARIASSLPVASEQIRSLEEQRRVLAELTGPIDLSPTEPPKRQPKPHSERVVGIRRC